MPMTSTRRLRPALTPLGAFAALLAAVAPAAAFAADEATQNVDAQGISFQAPAAWKSTPPQSQMRRAQLKVEPAKGDDEGAELIVFAFPGGAGTVDQNVERWQRMFRDKEGNPPKVDVKTVKGKNTDVNRVEIAGHYFPSNFPGQPKQPDRDNYRLLGAIVLTDNAGYFLRVVGPEKTVTGARGDFDKLLSSIRVTEK